MFPMFSVYLLNFWVYFRSCFHMVFLKLSNSWACFLVGLCVISWSNSIPKDLACFREIGRLQRLCVWVFRGIARKRRGNGSSWKKVSTGCGSVPSKMRTFVKGSRIKMRRKGVGFKKSCFWMFLVERSTKPSTNHDVHPTILSYCFAPGMGLNP